MGNYIKLGRIKSIAIAAALLLLLIAQTTIAKYSGGTGEPNDPYRIATAEDLNDIGNHYEDWWDKQFILVNDVNLAQYTGTQFKIIGPFSGVFDGNNHKVWNFTWTSTGRNGIGLFTLVGVRGQIKNLGMENINLIAANGSLVGGLVGTNRKGTITNCYSSGSISGISGVGGLVGENDAMITECYSTVSVLGSYGVGGLVGANGDPISGTITNSYSTSSVVGIRDVGGLAGGNSGTITNCYSTGDVSGNEYVGGLVGYNTGIVGYSRIINCYSIGVVDGNTHVGGLLGQVAREVVDSFWDIETSGQLTSAGGIPKTTAEMKTMSMFTEAGWDFVEVWGIGEGQTYPYLRFAPAGDFNYDKMIDLFDLAILSSHWLENAGH